MEMPKSDWIDDLDEVGFISGSNTLVMMMTFSDIKKEIYLREINLSIIKL